MPGESSSKDQQHQHALSGTSVHTIEGNVAGSRAALLEKKRLQDLEEYENKKRKIHEENSLANQTIESKFATSTQTSEVEQNFREKTIGLVTAEDFKKAADEAAAGEGDSNGMGGGRNDTAESVEVRAAREKAAKKARKKKLKEKKKMMATLSFAGDGVDAEEEDRDGRIHEQGGAISELRKNKPKKDPTVDTSFLPDPERDEQIENKRKQLEREWLERQEQVKLEKLEITYSYWDGSGHRRSVVCQKGQSIGDFLELARKDLCREFKELSNVASDALLYVKEDLILPHDLTFYDLIATAARGKSGPLFHFDVRDDVRLVNDSRIEKEESHPGKVVERRWYDRNKHIFPASRWEIYDPSKDYGGYTISDTKG